MFTFKQPMASKTNEESSLSTDNFTVEEKDDEFVAKSDDETKFSSDDSKATTKTLKANTVLCNQTKSEAMYRVLSHVVLHVYRSEGDIEVSIEKDTAGIVNEVIKKTRFGLDAIDLDVDVFSSAYNLKYDSVQTKYAMICKPVTATAFIKINSVFASSNFNVIFAEPLDDVLPDDGDEAYISCRFMRFKD